MNCIRFSLWFASVSFLLLVVDTSNGFILVSRCHRGSNLLLSNEGQQTPVQKKQELASLAGSEVSVYLTFTNVIYSNTDIYDEL